VPSLILLLIASFCLGCASNSMTQSKTKDHFAGKVPSMADHRPRQEVVTTRSGVLRAPGGEAKLPAEMEFSPTFQQVQEITAPVTKQSDAPPAKRGTMVGWLKSRFSHATKEESSAQPVKAPPKPAGESSSIDPRRVFRGPAAEPSNESQRSRDFSEAGVPGSVGGLSRRRTSSY